MAIGRLSKSWPGYGESNAGYIAIAEGYAKLAGLIERDKVDQQ